MLAQPAGHLCKGGARHHGGDGRHLGLVPAKMRAHDGGANGFDGLGQRHHFVPRHAAFKHVHRRDAEDDNEIRPHGFADAADHLDREAHPVFKAATPLIGAQIGLFDKESGEQIACRADNLDTVIAGQLGHRGAIGKIIQLFFDTGLIEFIGHKPTDPRPYRRRCHRFGRASERPGVQDLHADLHIRIGGMNGFGDEAMVGGLLGCRQLGAAAAFMVGHDAAGDDHPHPAAGTLGKIGGLAHETAGNILEPGVHRPHQDAVFQLGKAQIERAKDMGVTRLTDHVRSYRPV